MADDPDYAARLEIDYPEKLDRERGTQLVGWRVVSLSPRP